MSVVGTSNIRNAATPRVSSRAAKDVNTSPVLSKKYGSLSQSGRLTAKPRPLAARPSGSEASPKRRCAQDAREAPKNKQLKNAAKISPKAYALLPMIKASKCVNTTSAANTVAPDAKARKNSGRRSRGAGSRALGSLAV